MYIQFVFRLFFVCESLYLKHMHVNCITARILITTRFSIFQEISEAAEKSKQGKKRKNVADDHFDTEGSFGVKKKLGKKRKR